MGQHNTGAWEPMTTATKPTATTRTEPERHTVTIGGVLRHVDVNSGMAEFEWIGINRPLHFGPELASDVQSLEGKCVQVLGMGTFVDNGDRLIRIDLDAIRLEPGSQDWNGQDWPPPLNPNPVKSTKYPYDVDEFLRGIYEARRE